MQKTLKKLHAYTGETVRIEINVFDSGLPEPLIGAVAKLAIRKVGSSINKVEKECSIAGNVILAILDPVDTADAGSYKYEVRIKMNDEPDSLGIGDLFLEAALISTI